VALEVSVISVPEAFYSRDNGTFAQPRNGDAVPFLQLRVARLPTRSRDHRFTAKMVGAPARSAEGIGKLAGADAIAQHHSPFPSCKRSHLTYNCILITISFDSVLMQENAVKTSHA
jgi:hypothetical protein